MTVELAALLLPWALSAAAAWLLGPPIVAWLRGWSRQTIAQTTPLLDQRRHSKQATPTLGGCIVWSAVALGWLLSTPWSIDALPPGLLILGLGLVGGIDDLYKLRRQGHGLSPRGKLLGQTFIAAGVVCLSLPGECWTNSGAAALTIAWGTWIIVASSNAFNLTDGLDGLAAGCGAIAASALAVLIVLASGGSSVASTLAACVAGGLLGFLRVNRHPARVFMGDFGALPAGGVLGWIAWNAGHEWSWLAISLVFVAEALSVILQVGWYRYAGWRLLRCAPLHHHFELLGWPETTVVRRFWLVGVCAAMLGLIVGTSGPRQSRWLPTNRDSTMPSLAEVRR